MLRVDGTKCWASWFVWWQLLLALLVVFVGFFGYFSQASQRGLMCGAMSYMLVQIMYVWCWFHLTGAQTIRRQYQWMGCAQAFRLSALAMLAYLSHQYMGAAIPAFLMAWLSVHSGYLFLDPWVQRLLKNVRAQALLQNLFSLIR